MLFGSCSGRGSDDIFRVLCSGFRVLFCSFWLSVPVPPLPPVPLFLSSQLPPLSCHIHPSPVAENAAALFNAAVVSPRGVKGVSRAERGRGRGGREERAMGECVRGRQSGGRIRQGGRDEGGVRACLPACLPARTHARAHLLTDSAPSTRAHNIQESRLWRLLSTIGSSSWTQLRASGWERCGRVGKTGGRRR